MTGETVGPQGQTCQAVAGFAQQLLPTRRRPVRHRGARQRADQGLSGQEETVITHTECRCSRSRSLRLARAAYDLRPNWAMGPV
jgi:hypothetical protein